MNLFEKPKGWRNGQTIFNFLEWVARKKDGPVNKSYQMADPFYYSDEELHSLFKEFIAEMWIHVPPNSHAK